MKEIRPAVRVGQLCKTYRVPEREAGLRAILTFVIPVAFATNVPAEALVGRLSWPALLGAVALALSLFAGAHWFWKLGLRYYTGASA